jgi:hypothetical protein
MTMKKANLSLQKSREPLSYGPLERGSWLPQSGLSG